MAVGHVRSASEAQWLFCMLKLKDVSATGEGASKNMAKQVAALCVWKKILKIPVISAILNQSDASPMMATLALFGEDHLLSLKQRKKLRDLLVLVATNIEGEPLPIAEPIAEHIVEPIAESIPIPKKTPASLGIYELPYPDVGPVVKNQQTLKCTAEAKVPPLMHVKPNPSTIRKKAPESLGNNRSPYPYEEAAEKTAEVSGNSLKLEPRYGRNIPDPGPTSYGVRTHLLQDDYFFKFPKDLKEAAFKVINSKDFETKKEQAEALLAALQLNYTMAPVPCKNTKDPLVSVTLHCDYNGLFIDQKSNIYNFIIEYLNDMLR